MGANIGTSITGWILCLSYIEGSNGIASILSTATISAVVAVIGIIFRMFCKRTLHKNVGNIMLGFAILMTGMQMMSGAVSPLRESPVFIKMLTMFSNPIAGILVGIAFTAVLQSASATVGVLQALSVTGILTFASAFPIVLGIGVGAACPVLISAIGANKNGKRTALVYLINDLFGLILWSVIFYTVNAFVHFTFMDMTMTPVAIALLNTVFRLATVIVLFPFIPKIEKLVCWLVKDNKEDLEDEADFDLLEERLLNYPALAIAQCHRVMNGISKHLIEFYLEVLDTCLFPLPGLEFCYPVFAIGCRVLQCIYVLKISILEYSAFPDKYRRFINYSAVKQFVEIMQVINSLPDFRKSIRIKITKQLYDGRKQMYGSLKCQKIPWICSSQ